MKASPQFSRLIAIICIVGVGSLGVTAGQNLVELKYDPIQNRPYTTLWDLGDMVPTSTSFGIFNFANRSLARVNLLSGVVVGKFDDDPLDRFCERFVSSTGDTTISLYNETTILRSPTCQRHIYIYKHVHRVPGSSDVIVEVSASLRKSDRADYPFYQLELIVRFQEDLSVCSINIREKDSRFSDGDSHGGAVVDDSTIVLTYKPKVLHTPVHYLYKMNSLGIYACVTEISPLRNQDAIPYYDLFMYPAAYLNLDTFIYSSNSKFVIRKSTNFSTNIDTIPFELSQFEALTHLAKLDEAHLVGIRGEMGTSEIWDEWTLFICDLDLKDVRELGIYNEHEVLLNDLDVYDGIAYVFLFDRIRRRHLLHTIDLRNGPPTRRFSFVDDGR